MNDFWATFKFKDVHIWFGVFFVEHCCSLGLSLPNPSVPFPTIHPTSILFSMCFTLGAQVLALG